MANRASNQTVGKGLSHVAEIVRVPTVAELARVQAVPQRRTEFLRIPLLLLQRTEFLRIPLLVAVLSAAGTAGVVQAASGQAYASAGSGLNLVVDTQWVDGYGYRPVWIDITPTLLVNADRTLHVEFKVVSMWPQRELTVSQDIDIPAATTATLTTQLSVPQYFPWQSYELNVWEDGRFQKTLSQKNVGVTNWNQFSSEGLPTVLIVTDNAPAPPVVGVGGGPVIVAPAAPLAAGAMVPGFPNLAVLAEVLPVESIQQGYGTVNAGQPAAYPADLQAAVAIDRLPERWIDYTSVDLICVSWKQLDLLATKHPPRWAALRRWTAAGGNLLVSDVGDDFARLAELERLLGVSPPAETAGAAPRAGWNSPNKNDYVRELGPPFGKSMSGLVTVNGQQVVMAPAPPAPPERPAFVTRPVELGMVVAVAAGEPFAERPEVWGAMLRTLTPDRWAWYRRHGVSLDRDNAEFWNWLIPGVGLAPVTEFRVLITLFVILIGPLNYYWLKRRGRLHLLLVIVPFCALVVTSSLFGYAILADGLGIRARARSYTAIDQRRGEAVCWSRVTYYAGLSPSGGMNFPDDVAVIPIQPQGSDSQRTLPNLGLIWSEGEQNLARGWLPSRTQTQLLTVRSRPSTAGLRWIGPAKEGDPPRIENRLETHIKRLLLADDEGNHYRAIDVPPGASVALEPADVTAEETELVKMFRAGTPAVPEGFDASVYSTLGGRRYNPWRARGVSSLPEASLSSGRLEQKLRETPGVSGALPSPLPPRSYLAFVECSPELVWGVPSPRPEAGLHVVVGRW
ncbi:MAG TPA: hypothetical protein VMV69_04335 [Pirellulales bacterium]|nr:hypothetical protein [Pirellulales bacterium]